MERGGPVVPVFILDPVIEESYGAAPKWRLAQSIENLSRTLETRGSRLILRRGNALDELQRLAQETGAKTVVWSRLYDSRSTARDRDIKSAVAVDGVEPLSVNGSLLFEPWTVSTGSGGFYRVYTPFWRAVRDRDVDAPLSPPSDLAAPDNWPDSEALSDWALGAEMGRGATVVAQHCRVGEEAAQARLGHFLDEKIARYQSDRDRLDLNATSGLSENLAYGEISPRQIWHAAKRAIEIMPASVTGQIEHFMKELVWREFAYHLIFHTPHLETDSWRENWGGFPWRQNNPDAECWRRGTTGIDVIDAAMRELYVTGMMHNRARMLVASLLTKHLLTDWRVGEAWFKECLVDWDPASNAMGWQWVAGSGPDAAPYFRIFNPELQATKFDPQGAYRERFLAEGRRAPKGDALAFYDAIPRSWAMTPADQRPEPVIALSEGRKRALEAYQGLASA